MNPEEESEIVLWDWLKTKGINVKEVYFNRINKLNAPTFQTSGLNKKPDFIVKIDRGYGTEFIAIEIKNTKNSRNVHDSGKILLYYENFILKKTKYLIDGKEIEVKHFVVATEKSKEGKLFNEDDTIISNQDSSDEWRKTNSKLKLIPEFEYQRTSDFLRRLWAEWRTLRKKLDFKESPSIGILIANPTKDNNPHLFSIIYTDWLDNKSWKQRFWRL